MTKQGLVYIYIHKTLFGHNTNMPILLNHIYIYIDLLITLIIPPASTKLKGGILVSPCLSVKKTRKKKQVCGAACFTAAEIKFSKDVRLWTESCLLCIFNKLVGTISYVHISSSNFRRCVACKVCFKIQNFGNFLIFVTLTLSFFYLGSKMTQ